MTQLWLSVLIPTYNGEDYLPSTLDSIILQDDPNIECIIVDDQSTDSTPSLIRAYTDKLPIKTAPRSNRGNWPANTNQALSVARGEYICILHQDDIWLKDRLQILKNLSEKYPDINLFLHPSWFIDAKGKRLGLWRCPLPNYPFLVDAGLMMERLLVQNFISMPGHMIKREIALKVGGLDEELLYPSDWDFWLKISSFGKIMYYPKPLSEYRLHQVSQTVVRSKRSQDFQKQLDLVLERHLNCWNTNNRVKKSTQKVARFSIEINTALAGMLHKNKVNFFKILCSFLALGPLGWHRYLRDSRIWERLSARLRAGLTPKSVS